MNEKSLALNSVYNVIYKSLNVLFPLATSIYVSRVLLSSGVGQVASAKNLVTYFTLLAALGLPTYGTKKIAELRNNEKELSRTFSELFIINFVSTLICTFAYFSIVFAERTFNSDLMLYAIVGLQVVLNIFNIDWFYQGIEEYKYIMLRSLIVKIISFAFIIVFVRSQSDYLFYAFASVLGVALNYVLNVLHFRKIVSFTLKNLQIRRHLKYLFILFSSAIAVEIYTLADITMLTAMTRSSYVGYYSNAVNGIKTVKEMIVAICAVILPRLSYYHSQGKNEQFAELAQKGLKILMFFSVPAAVGCYILADKIVIILFGEGFTNSILTVRILAMSIITIGISNFIGYQILIVIGKEKRMLTISIFGALFNIILNSALIPIYYHNGAAFASMITECIVCILYLLSFKKSLGLNWMPKYGLKIAFSTLIMGIGVYFLRSISESILLSSVVSVSAGIILYSISNIIIKNEISEMTLDKIKYIMIKNS